MKKNLLIVFVKNVVKGKAKTRLAKSIGDDEAFNVYKRLVEITEEETRKLQDCDLYVYFSDSISEDKWPGAMKFVQHGNDLGERMKNAFQRGFNIGYEKILGIGSDLPNLSSEIIQDAFNVLETTDTVFGPAEDGGYYLLGMKRTVDEVFDGKAWSTEGLLKQTISDLEMAGIRYVKLSTLNDVDTIDDLANSCLADEFSHLL